MDQIKKNQELKDLVKNKAYIENPQNKPVTDGPINPDRFFTTGKSRTVFITQEPYGDNGGWDLSEALNAKNSLKEQSRQGLPTIKNEVKCASILNNQGDHPMSTAAYDTYKETVAVINVKKEPNVVSRANSNDVKNHAMKNNELLQAQYENLKLTGNDTTVLAGTEKYLKTEIDNNVEILGRKFDKQTDVTSIKKGNHTYIKYDNGDGKGPIIAAPHPAASRYGKGDYAGNIEEIRNQKVPREDCQRQPQGQNNNDTHRIQENVQQNSDINQLSSVRKSLTDVLADVCQNSMDCVRKNPKTVTIVAAGVVVVATGGFYLYKKLKKRSR